MSEQENEKTKKTMKNVSKKCHTKYPLHIYIFFYTYIEKFLVYKIDAEPSAGSLARSAIYVAQIELFQFKLPEKYVGEK